MTVNVEVDTDALGPSGVTTTPGFARVSMRSAHSGNTVEIGTIDLSNGELVPALQLHGSIGLLMSDLFSSVTVNPAFSFGLFDNVQVLEGLVPLEPAPEGLVGDYNEDHIVNAADYVVWRNSEGTAFALPNRDPMASGDVGPDDYAAWVAHFGETMAVTAVTGAVPEPGTLWLVFMSFGGAMRLRRLEETHHEAQGGGGVSSDHARISLYRE
jgi:hypothetical protein